MSTRGWALLGISAATAVLGRVLGLVELLMISVGAAALVGLALAYVRMVPLSLEASRHARPPRLHAGTLGRVELMVRNAGSRRSPFLVVLDPFDGGRRVARFVLPPLAPGEVATAAYRVPTERRGLYELGPLELRLSDPFGLAARSVPACPVSELTVYPRIELIEAPPASLGDVALPASGGRSALAITGEDFYALREYERGDDLRRVHWKSTAKQDTLMIRQEETARHGRATVVLDLRRQLHSADTLVHSADTLEAAVSAAASILDSCSRSHSAFRLVCSDGTDSGFGSGRAHLDTLLQHLAVADAGDGPAPSTLVAALPTEGRPGTLVLVTTAALRPAEVAEPIPARGFIPMTIVLLGASTAAALPPVPGATVVPVGPGQPLAPAWSRAAPVVA